MLSTATKSCSQGYQIYQQERRHHWDQVGRNSPRRRSIGGYYHRRLQEIYRFLIPPNQRVLEVGSGNGDLLAALQPSFGLGIDFSREMVALAASRHPTLRFVQADGHALPLQGEFDTIILSDLANDVWDVQAVLEEVARLASPRTRIILNIYSWLWQIPLTLAQRLGLAHPTLQQNWLTPEDLTNLLHLAGLEVIRHWPEIISPLAVPFINPFLNRILARLWPFRDFALTNILMARLAPGAPKEPPEPLVSVIVPARNEAGNIEQIFERTPEMGSGTELIFVEGHSRDDTYEKIEDAIRRHPERRCRLLRQTGVGKGDAVRLGFSEASSDILMILDADLTVPPEDLPRFYQALCSRKGEFANGVRLIYPMEGKAMRPLNFLGNKFFSLAFTWLLGQSIKDTLCGTKVLWKSDYCRIAANRDYFGDFDPFGDFDLLLGAAKLGLKIVEVPIRYRERTYGTTNIERWKHGWLLLRMVMFAARRIKFV